MSKITLYDYQMDMYADVEQDGIEEIIKCFRSLRKAKHHRVITVNDLLKMFGFQETEVGDDFEVDDLVGVRGVSYKPIDAIGGKRYLLEYVARPIYRHRES